MYFVLSDYLGAEESVLPRLAYSGCLTDTVQVAPQEYFIFLIRKLIRKIGHMIIFVSSKYHRLTDAVHLLHGHAQGLAEWIPPHSSPLAKWVPSHFSLRQLSYRRMFFVHINELEHCNRKNM